MLPPPHDPVYPVHPHPHISHMFGLQSALHDAGDQRYVTLSLELRGWDFIKHQFRMRVDTPMYTIKVRLPETGILPSALACFKSDADAGSQ